MWVNRFEKETTLVVSFPQNPVAGESVTRYIQALKSVYLRVAEQGVGAAPHRRPASPATGLTTFDSSVDHPDEQALSKSDPRGVGELSGR
jgi:hypothetical protein